jgi:hypothetical protein
LIELAVIFLENFEQFGIKMLGWVEAVVADGENLECFIVTEGRLVSTLRAQRVVYIGDAQNARRNGNLLTPQALRIT